LYEEKFNVNIVYIIDEIICHNGHAEGTGVNRYNELQFRKLSQRLKDREKGNNILTYTKNKTLLLQRKEDDPFYTIETGAEVTVKDDMTLQIWPMLSSKYRIVSSDVCFLTVPSAGKYALIYDHAVSKFAIVSTYESLTQTPIATIEVEDNTDIVFRDIRIPGGGEQSPIPNYEMIDTGSLKGHPLRYGSLFVIELPERFKGMKDVFKTEVEKHMTSGDYPIFVFKD
jgi:hypothetical protein